MTTVRTDEERIEAFLASEAPSQLADRVLTATFERTRVTRQVGGTRWRVFDMGIFPAGVAAATAALTLVAVIATALVVTRSDPPTDVGAAGLVMSCPAGSAPSEGAAEPPLGLALVCLDGTVASVLDLPRDAWMPDLSADGATLIFRTSSHVGPCDGCLVGPRPALVQVGATTGDFLPAPTVEGIGADLDPRTIAMTAWSPDGRRIAYQAELDGNLDLFVSELAPRDDTGTELGRTWRLTSDPAIDEFPAWSPDGSKILYANSGSEPLDESGFSPSQEIWSVPASGGVPTRLTDNDVPDTQPEVGAEGWVVYWHDGAIWTMNVDGDRQAVLGIDTGEVAFGPRLSPDGSKLALLRYDPSGRTTVNPATGEVASLPLLDVVIADLMTGTITDVGSRVATDLNLVSWTPDGKALLINRYDDGS